MKQIHLSWLLVAAAVITACQKERSETEPIVEKATYVYSVKATISSDAETRTDYDADGKFSWTAGDRISVLFHDGEIDRFFTLTADAAGATATFSGTIERGFIIGASDGNADDLKIWALYPASDKHSYVAGSNPSFHVNPSVDFTETGFSANIPMYGLLAEEGAFSFKNLTSTYKFIVKDLDPSVEKVKFVVYNQETYGLSGSWPIHAGEIYLNYDYATPGSEKSTLTFISNVTDGQAVFYVPTRYWGKFQPVVRVYDADSDELLKEVTAGKYVQPTSLTKVPQIVISASSEPKEAVIEADDVAVKVGKSVSIGATTNSSAAIEYASEDEGVATVSEDGTVTGIAVGTTTITLSVPEVEGKYTSASKTITVTVSEASASVIDVDGDISDWESISPAYLDDSKSRIREFRFKNDADNVYFLIKMRKNRAWLDPDAFLGIGFDTDNDSTTGSGIGNVPGCEARVKSNPFTNTAQGQPVCVNGFDTSAEINGTADESAVCVFMYDDGSDISSSSSNIYLEIGIPRSKLNLPAAGASITVGCSYNWYVTDSVSVTLE